MCRLCFFVIVAILHASADSMADELELREAQRRFLISGMRAEREKLRSGQVVITGEHWSDTTLTLGMIRLPVRFDVYFDHDSKSYRYTQRDYEPYDSKGMDPQMKARLLKRSVLPHGTTPEGVEWVTTDNGGTVVRTPEYDLHHTPDHPHVTRLAPGAAHGFSVREWDLSTLGLVDWPSFEGGLRLNAILDAYETIQKCHFVESTPSGLSCLKLRSEWNPHADSVEYEIWIDEKHGMTPISISRQDLNDSLKEVSRSDVGWKEINGVMVPITFRIRMLHQKKYPEGYDLTLDWSHVNEPIDPKVFSPAGITDSKSALVADMRLGPVVVEQVHPPQLPAIATNPQLNTPIIGASRLFWLIFGNMILLLGGLWWYVRRRAKS